MGLVPVNQALLVFLVATAASAVMKICEDYS